MLRERMICSEADRLVPLPARGLIAGLTVGAVDALISAVTADAVSRLWITGFTDLTDHTCAEIDLYTAALPAIDWIKVEPACEALIADAVRCAAGVLRAWSEVTDEA